MDVIVGAARQPESLLALTGAHAALSRRGRAARFVGVGPVPVSTSHRLAKRPGKSHATADSLRAYQQLGSPGEPPAQQRSKVKAAPQQIGCELALPAQGTERSAASQDGVAVAVGAETRAARVVTVRWRVGAIPM